MDSLSVERLSLLTASAIHKAGGQQALSRKSGLSQGTISRWKSQANGDWPQVGHLISLASFMGWEIGELMQFLHSGDRAEIPTVQEIIGYLTRQESLTYAEIVALHRAIAAIPIADADSTHQTFL